MRDRRRFACLVVATLLMALSLQAQWKTRWEYEGARGADHWSELDPAYAACNGKGQSPIDIEARKNWRFQRYALNRRADRSNIS